MTSTLFLNKNFFWKIIFFFALISSMYPNTLAKEFINQSFSLSSSGGIFQYQTQTILTPKKGKNIFWSFHAQNLGNGRVTSELTRITIPRSRTLYIFDTNATNESIEKFSFSIESPKENNFFRLHQINSTPKENFVPTLTLKNDSLFSFTLKGWEITGENFSFLLPNEEMDAQQKRTFTLPLNIKGDTIRLISPLKRVKDKVTYPTLKRRTVYQRQKPLHKKDVRPKFIIIPSNTNSQ